MYESGLKTRTIDAIRNKSKLWSEADIKAKFQDADVAAEMIATKLAKNEYMDHPDLPGNPKARL